MKLDKELVTELQEECLLLLRQKDFYIIDLRNYIEKYISDNLGYCCRMSKSINEWKPDKSFIDKTTGQGLNQKTVFLSARLFDLWETGLISIFNEAVKEINDKLKVIPSYSTKYDMKIVYQETPLANVKLIDIYRWEIKTTMGKADSFTSITHGKNKCPNYILIKYKIDKNFTLNKRINRGILQAMFVIVWNNMDSKWKGEHTDHSSWTTLKVPTTTYLFNKKILVVGNMITSWKLSAKQLKYCKFSLHNF